MHLCSIDARARFIEVFSCSRIKNRLTPFPSKISNIPYQDDFTILFVQGDVQFSSSYIPLLGSKSFEDRT